MENADDDENDDFYHDNHHHHDHYFRHGPSHEYDHSHSYLIFVTNITNEICGEKFVMWINLGFICMTDVKKSEISLTYRE